MATAGKNMEVALRVTADLQQARQQVQQLRQELNGLNAAGGQSGRAQAQGANTATKAQSETTQATKDTTDQLKAQARAAKEAAEAQKKAARELEQEQKRAAAAAKAAAAEDDKRAKAALNQANAATAAANKNARTQANLRKNADRMLPAQMTDITVGLATGQSPFMVAMQQGGQLKDMYGGITPAIGAVAKATLGLVNPTTLAIGAVAALGVAWYQGAKEGEEFHKALTLSGNAAGLTTSQLSGTAQAVGRITGAYGLAIETAKTLAATGRVASAQLGVVTEATVSMAQIGAAAVGEMVSKFEELGKSPVEASRKLNEQYNYLKASVYEQIKALQEQGRAEEAAALAQRTYAQAMIDRSNEVKAELNLLGRAFNWVGDRASGMWNSIKNVGRASTLGDQLAEAQQQYEVLLKGSQRVGGFLDAIGIKGVDNTKAARQQVMDRIALLQQQLAQEEAVADAQRKAAQDNRARIDASDSWDARTKSRRGWSEQLKDEIKKIKEEAKLLGKTEEEVNKQIAAARDKLTPKNSPKTNPVDTAFQTQLQQLTQARAAAEQGLANAQANVATTQEQATTKLDAWLSVNQNALKLDATRIAQLRSLAQQTDAAVAATKALQDARARADRITSGMASVDSALAQATGRTVEAEVSRIQERYRKLRQDLAAESNGEGLIKIDRLINIETARAQLQQLQREVEQVFGNHSRAEQSLQLGVTAGLTSELDAKRQILALNGRTAEQVAQLLPRMRELAAVTGDPSMAAGLADMELRVQGLRTQANELKNAFSDALGTSFANALQSLADGTASLGDAVRGLLNDLAQGMAQWASQQLAMQAQSAVMGMFGQGAGSAASGAATAATSAAGVASTGMDAAASASNAAAIAAETTARAASTAAITAEVAASTAAAAANTTLAAAATAASTAATAMAVAMQAAAASSTGSSTSSMFSSIAGAAASSGGGFASGGYTGAGGKYQPAGIVHAGEFVHRQEVVNQPGALAFLSQFNRVGMAALKGWQGYADGGLVAGGAHSGVPNSANFAPVAAGGGATTLENRQVFNLIDDPDRIASVMGSARGEAAITVLISRNPGKFRQLLGVNS